MKNYFSIGEFAKLRNVHINSLLYYEKLGILRPAYIDPDSKYRYYSPNQLNTLDQILVCIESGIPLKKLKEYMDENGSMNTKEFLMEIQSIIQQKIHKIETDLHRIEYCLNRIDSNQFSPASKGHYVKNIKERYFIVSPLQVQSRDIQKFEEKAFQLFIYAEEHGLAPVFPCGLFIQFSHKKENIYIFFEILQKNIEDKKIINIPEATFDCMQIDYSLSLDSIQALRDNFDTTNEISAIITNVSFISVEKFQLEHQCVEIQVIDSAVLEEAERAK